VAIDLLGFTVFLQETAEDPHASHPQYLSGKSGVPGSLSSSDSSVPTFPLRREVLANPRAGVDLDGFPDDQTVLDQLPDILPGVSHGDLVDLSRVEPNLLLSDI